MKNMLKKCSVLLATALVFCAFFAFSANAVGDQYVNLVSIDSVPDGILGVRLTLDLDPRYVTDPVDGEPNARIYFNAPQPQFFKNWIYFQDLNKDANGNYYVDIYLTEEEAATELSFLFGYYEIDESGNPIFDRAYRHLYDSGKFVANNISGHGAYDGDINWTLSYDGTLVINGVGAIDNYTLEQTAPWYAYRDLIKNVVIEEGITSVGEYAFYNHTALQTVTVANTVEKIEYAAFNSCTSLTTVTLNNSSTVVDGNAFSGCTALPTTSESSATYAKIGENSFYILLSAPNTASFTVNASTKVIAGGAFKNNTALTTVTIPASVTSIGDEAFRGCTTLNNVTLQNAIKIIGNRAFYNCTSLDTVTFNAIPEYIGASAFANTAIVGTLYENAYYLGSPSNPYMILWKSASTDIPSLHINENTKTIASVALANCAELASVQLPEGLLYIGDSAFNGCSSLVSVEIPNTTLTIGDQAFRNCSSLSILELGESVESIGNSAFRDNSALTVVTLPDSLKNIGYNAFRDCTALTTVGNISTSLGYKTFANCTSLTDVFFSDSVTSIGKYAFMNCTNLENVLIPATVKSIAYGALYGCESIDTLSLPFVGESVKGNYTNVGYIFGALTANDNSKYVPSTLKNLLVGGKLYANAFNGTSISTLILDKTTTAVNSGVLNGITSAKVYYLGNSTEWSAVDGASAITPSKYADSAFSVKPLRDVYEFGEYFYNTDFTATIADDVDVTDFLRFYSNPLFESKAYIGSVMNKFDAPLKGTFSIVGYSLLLEGKIGLKFYVQILDNNPAGTASELSAVVRFNGVDYDVTVTQTEEDGYGYYTVFYIPAKEMNSTVTLTITGNGATRSLATSVKDYVTYINDNADKYTECIDLINTMYNYGQYANYYFTGTEFTPAPDLSDVIVDIPDEYSPVKTADVSGLTFCGTSLLLKSDTVIRHYFLLEDGNSISDYTFTYGNNSLTPKLEKNNIYYVDIDNIPARFIGKMTKFTITKAGETSTINYSALSYAKITLADENADEGIKNLMKAMYIYYLESVDYYFESNEIEIEPSENETKPSFWN